MRPLRAFSAALALAVLASGVIAQSKRNLDVGDEVLPLPGADLEGNELSWDRFENRAVILYFHSTGSRFSVQCLKDLAGLVVKDAELTSRAAILVVGNTADDEVTAKTLKPLELPAVVTVAPERKGYERYRAVAFPTAYTVGRDRRIVHAARGHGPLFATRVHAAARFAAGVIDRAQLDAVLSPTAPKKDPGPKVTRSLRMAQRMAASGMFDQARSALATALEKSPKNTELLEALVRVELGAGDADAAAACIDRLEAVTGRKPASRMLRAELYLLGDDPTAAESELKGLPVKSTQMALVKGKVLERLGRHEEAAALYRKALERVLKDGAGR